MGLCGAWLGEVAEYTTPQRRYDTRHEMLTQRAPFCIGAMAKKGTLSQHFVKHVVPPLTTPMLGENPNIFLPFTPISTPAKVEGGVLVHHHQLHQMSWSRSMKREHKASTQWEGVRRTADY